MEAISGEVICTDGRHSVLRSAHNWKAFANKLIQYGGSPVKVGDEEYSLFRDHE
jgi:hypothetical protein